MLLRWTGTANFQEQPITGFINVWQPDSTMEVTGTRLATLRATAGFVVESNERSSFADQAADALALLASKGVGTLSSKYRFFIPGTQHAGTGNAKDRSPNAADAVLGAGLADATAWGNKGYFTTAAAVNGFASIPLAKSSFDLGSQSVIFSMLLNKAAPAARGGIYGNADGISAQGFYLSCRITTGKVRPVLNTSGGVVSGLADSTAVFANGTDHVITVAIDGITKQVFLWMDGTLSDTYNNAFTGGTTPTQSAAVGMNVGTAGGTGFAQKCKGLHLLVMDGGLPLNISHVAQRIDAGSLLPIGEVELVF